MCESREFIAPPPTPSCTPIVLTTLSKRGCQTKSLLYSPLCDNNSLNGITCSGGEENATPLHDAVASGCAEVIRALVLKGADKSALDSNGKTPADLAPAGSKVLQVLTETASLLSESEQLEQSMTQAKVQSYVVAADSSLVKQLEKLKVRIK